MDREEFIRRMAEVDESLIAKKVSALWRPILAWMFFTGRNFYGGMQPRSDLSEFEGENLYFRIAEWYEAAYPKHSTFQEDWGQRWFLLRGEFYKARIPVIFNPTDPLDPYEYLDGITPQLRSLMTPDDDAQLRYAFNGFFWQASDLNLCLTTTVLGQQPTLERELLERGFSDLLNVGRAFNASNSTTVLFEIQQAAEKYLKAFLIIEQVVQTEDELRKKFGHSVVNLFAACEGRSTDLDQRKPHVDLLNFGPDVRYRKANIDTLGVLNRFNLAYSLCHSVAKWVLNKPRTRRIPR